jgi:hypothetical protein
MVEPEPVSVDPHYSPQFYAELWGTSTSTVVRWFQDKPSVLKLKIPSKNGKRERVELRIPFSLAGSPPRYRQSLIRNLEPRQLYAISRELAREQMPKGAGNLT